MNKLFLVAFLGLIATACCQTFGGQFAGTLIGTYYNTNQNQCSYWCYTPGVAPNCYAWSWNPVTLVCQYFSSVYGFYYNGGYGGCPFSSSASNCKHDAYLCSKISNLNKFKIVMIVLLFRLVLGICWGKNIQLFGTNDRHQLSSQ